MTNDSVTDFRKLFKEGKKLLKHLPKIRAIPVFLMDAHPNSKELQTPLKELDKLLETFEDEMRDFVACINLIYQFHDRKASAPQKI